MPRDAISDSHLPMMRGGIQEERHAHAPSGSRTVRNSTYWNAQDLQALIAEIHDRENIDASGGWHLEVGYLRGTKREAREVVAGNAPHVVIEYQQMGYACDWGGNPADNLRQAQSLYGCGASSLPPDRSRSALRSAYGPGGRDSDPRVWRIYRDGRAVCHRYRREIDIRLRSNVDEPMTASEMIHLAGMLAQQIGLHPDDEWWEIDARYAATMPIRAIGTR